MLPRLFIRLFIAVFMATLGAFLAVSFKKISHRSLCILISFAAGALLAVSLFDIFPETVEIVGFLPAIFSFLSGYLVFFFITRFVFHICPACAATHTEVNFKAVTLAMVVALSVHSFMDGLAIYSGYVATSKIGLLIFLAVAYHKLPEGMALALVSRGSGAGRARSFFLSFSIESLTTFAGGVAGLVALLPGASRWVGYVLGHVGGGFVFLVVHALLSEVIKHHPRSTLLAAFLGAVSISLVGVFFGGF
ncbi:MAG: ZIP family metal transporter [Candidatus Omnitrophica bacterium]|nr:ZIP family metal transporter [Candidatus Omnitrophota bacterium]